MQDLTLVLTSRLGRVFGVRGCGMEVLLTEVGATGQSGAQPSPARVLALPGQGRASCFAVGSLSPFCGQLL